MRTRLPLQVLATAVVLAVTCLPEAVAAQQRPLTPDDPDVVGPGVVLFEAGVETGSNVRYKLSGLSGDRIAVPVGLSFGLGTIAELQLDAGYNWLSIDSREDAPLASRVPTGITWTSDVIDVTVATKIKLLSEGAHRPAMGVRFATRLPNASNESGLGLDTTDFSFSILGAKTVRGVRIVGNAGLAILSNPLIATVQDDAFVGGVSLTRRVSPRWEMVGDVAWQSVWFADVPPVGAEPLGEVRAGARFTRGHARFDAGVLAGFTARSPGFGVIAGVTLRRPD